MDYFNIDDNNPESTSYAAGDFNAYPFQGQTSTTEVTNETFASGWGVGVHPDHEVGLPRNLEAEASFDTVTSTTPHDTQTHGDDALSFPEYYCAGVQPGNQVDWSRSLEPGASFDTVTSATPYDTQAHNDGALSFPEYYWPATDLHPQYHGPGTASWENPFTGTEAPEASTMVPGPSSIPLDYRWNESGPSAGMFYDMNVQAPHQHSTGWTRNVTVPTLRFQPYEASNARLNEHTNAEAGPSTLTPPFISYMASSSMYPSGGLPEGTADADKNQTSTEENAAPTNKRARGTAEPRNWRTRYQGYMHRLRAWAKAWRGLNQTPTHEEALATALQVIKMSRAPVYPEPRLKKGTNMRSAPGKRAPDAEDKRRKGIRGLNEELSCYYQLGVNKSVWGCPELLSKVLDELEELLRLFTVPSA